MGGNLAGSEYNLLESSEPNYPYNSTENDILKFPLPSDVTGENIIFQSLPNPDLLDNSEIITDFYEYLENDNIIYDRPPSIIATYYVVSTLYDIDPSRLALHADKILDYLTSHYNAQTEVFEENINYTYYNEGYPDGRELLLAPYTPEITHEMALVVLKKCDRLAAFSGGQVSNWISGIWGTQNVDGGFGSLYSPNSTLLETYYSVEALLALNDFDATIFSVFQKNVIGNFIASRQRSLEILPFGNGAFSEYSEDVIVGWEFFYASWLALNTIEMIEGDFSGVKDNFINFVLDNGLNNPSTHCFYSQWNDKASPDIITYYGTAILGDCIRILEAEAQFPDIYNCQNTLISANLLDQTRLDREYNYFYWASDVPGDDLFSQFLIVNYLTNIGVWNLVDESKYIDYYDSFLTEKGGGTYISNIWNSAKGDYLKFKSLKYAGINESQIFDLVMSRQFATYFGDLRNISTNVQDQSYKIMRNWNEWTYYPIATNYFSLSLLNEFGLLENFAAAAGADYDDFIWWIHGKLTSEGFFSNSPEEMVCGNLESTFYALQSQQFLLNYDVLNDLYDYYTLPEISSILSYCEQFIMEDGDYWYVNCSESIENKNIGRFQALKYVVSIEEILGGNGINAEKLKNYLVFAFENEWDACSIQEKTELLVLMDKMECSYVDLISETSHVQIRDLIQYIITQDHYPEDDVKFVSQLLKDGHIKVYMDIPPNQILGESYTYLAQFSSISSVISVDNLSIRGYDTDFTNWASLGSMAACEVMPQFDEFDPYSWGISFDFTFRETNYSYPFSVDVSIPFFRNAEIISNGDTVASQLSVECPESLASKVIPELYLYDDEANFIAFYQVGAMAVDHQQEVINWNCDISDHLHQNQNYTLVWDFNFDFLENISTRFLFLGDTPPILHSETLSNVENHFEFLISYSDNQENSAEYVNLTINGATYSMHALNGNDAKNKIFKYDLDLDIGNYTYHFSTSDGKYYLKYPETGFFYVNVLDLSEIVPEKKATKIGNYIIETILSLGSVGAGVSGIIFKNKQKIYQKILSTHI
ncbi:hypothetical protein DSAG12_02156 [Promethearchaeum syntrophicum]|uniref:Prenyltransferase and squalene oxidase repeat protein n=1 Tax=Promethearchaeum syntrophicum TaxID=2594042 RepID=A0A5B9DCA6_9ARCH|nr:hypothetical protein [Candidatus Prometheoarchaeum syntrophicum]